MQIFGRCGEVMKMLPIVSYYLGNSFKLHCEYVCTHKSDVFPYFHIPENFTDLAFCFDLNNTTSFIRLVDI